MNSGLKALCITASIAALAAAPSFAQTQKYPSKTVRVLSSGGPGGNNDTQTRGLAEFLAERLGQPFVVENRTGAGGILAGDLCSKAVPDGHTVCTFGVNAISWNPVLRLNMPFDPIKDMIGVAHMGWVDSIITAHPSAPFNSLTELIAYARANPKAVRWGGFGLNTSGFFYTEWLRRKQGIQIILVPFKTSIDAQTSVVGGHIHVNQYAAGGAMGYIKSGQVKAIAVNSDKRNPDLPNVQTDAEAGIDLPLRTWFGMLAPAATQRDHLLRLNAEINRALVSPAFKEKFMDRLGFVNPNMDLDQFHAFMKRDRDAFERLATDLELQRK